MTDVSRHYQLICGLEVHAELKTQSKMFCGCKNDPFHAPEPNCFTCPVCLGLPGALPVANAKAIEWTIKLGLALHCSINLNSKFDRKHYFYPDLPKGYQISQYDLPFCHDGWVDTSEGRVRIRRIHLEEDTGKLIHRTVEGEKVTLIDFNRSSVPLVEVVTEPDIHTATQAAEYSKILRETLRALNIADCDMEQGGMRLEANLSLRPVGSTELPNYKVELKNINSFRFVQEAVADEIERQSKLLDQGKTPAQETRGYNSQTGHTFSQRSKESAEDYRYFPDPDLPPFEFTIDQIEQWRSELPELPADTVARWSAEYKIEPRFSQELLKEPLKRPMHDKLFASAQSKSLDVSKVASAVVNNRIVADTEEIDIDAVIDRYARELQTTTIDDSELRAAIKKVLADNPDVVTKYKAGQKQVVGFVMGQVMRNLKGADPAQVSAAILDELE